MSTMPSDSPATSSPVAAPAPFAWYVYLVLDLVLVVVFAAIGRSSHGEDVGGMLVTAWPFLVGTVVGWLISRGHRSPAVLWPTGVVVWLSTEVVGMVLRALTGQGTALSFVIVSAVVLAVFLLGHRLLLRALSRLYRS